jgi:hypothetical protein
MQIPLQSVVRLLSTPARLFKGAVRAKVRVDGTACAKRWRISEFMSHETRWMCGVTLILVPTIVYGGLTVLGILTRRAMGAPAPENLTSEQITFYRAGHAHAGVLAILSLFLQIAIDYAAAPTALIWPLRIGALAAALLVSGGFFGAAHMRGLRILLYLSAALLTAVTLTVGIGLLRTT